jgi:hypothetical protein
VNEHLEAIDYDLLTLGLDVRDVGTPKLGWRRLRSVLTYLPSTSALARAVHGETAEWTVTEHLLAAAVDALHAANWQRGGGKQQKPKPIDRPGGRKKKSFATETVPLSEAGRIFGGR